MHGYVGVVSDLPSTCTTLVAYGFIRDHFTGTDMLLHHTTLNILFQHITMVQPERENSQGIQQSKALV